MIRIGGQVRGLQQTQEVLQQAMPIILEQAESDTRASLFQVTRTAQRNYLSGPRPTRLGVITNRLRGSLSEGAPDLVYDVKRQALRIEGRIGTNVEYGPIHEFGGVIKPKKGKYLAIPTALAKTAAGALQDKYNRPLRQIQDLFLSRTRSGTLYAAEKTPATGRQRRSGLRILFWLVRQVRIPARPFLAPALRDNTQWIADRFAFGLRRAERRITALFKGR